MNKYSGTSNIPSHKQFDASFPAFFNTEISSEIKIMFNTIVIIIINEGSANISVIFPEK